jgi:hypothetical protein
MNIRRIGALLAAAVLGVGGAVALATPAAASTYGPFQLRHSSQYCLEVPSADAGAQLIISYCGGSGTHSQHFRFEDTGGGPWQYFIHTEYNNMCLMPGAPGLYNSTIIQWPCGGLDGQHWILGFPNEQPNLRNLYNIYKGYCADNLQDLPFTYVKQMNCYPEGWFVLTSMPD